MTAYTVKSVIMFHLWAKPATETKTETGKEIEIAEGTEITTGTETAETVTRTEVIETETEIRIAAIVTVTVIETGNFFCTLCYYMLVLFLLKGLRV